MSQQDLGWFDSKNIHHNVGFICARQIEAMKLNLKFGKVGFGQVGCVENLAACPKVSQPAKVAVLQRD